MYRPPTLKLAAYAYEAWYDTLDYAYALDYFKKAMMPALGGCTSIRKGNWYGRNFDWLYDEGAEFVVHSRNKRRVIGVASNVSTLTDAFVESGQDSDKYRVVPFMLVDGINESGLLVSTNVVPTDKGDNKIVMPAGTVEHEICTLMLPRFLLDNFDTATAALDYLTEHVKVFHPKLLNDMHYDQHFMLAYEDYTYCIEFVDGRYRVFDVSGRAYMTNFHLTGVTPNADGMVYTPATGLASSNGVTDNGSGLERYNLIAGSYAGLGDKVSMQNMMRDLAYTRAYATSSWAASPRWDTEFVGNGRTVDTPTSGYDAVQVAGGAAYTSRTRAKADTWQTVHSSVYDIQNKKLYVAVQENFDTRWEVSIMAQEHIQHLRGTTAKNDGYTGDEGEFTYDTQVHTARVHDGSKKGGYELVNTSSAQTITGKKTFSASPVVPTPTAGDSSTQVATTAFVANAVSSGTSDAVKTSGNQTVAGTKTFSTSPVVPTPAAGDNTTKVATTAFVQNIAATFSDNSAAARNGVYRYEKSPFTEAQLTTKLNNGDFSGLCIGQYIDKEMTSSLGGKETVRWMFAGFDSFLNNGDTPTTRHHIVMVPENCFKTAHRMNPTDTTVGAYKGSEMYMSTLPAYLAAIKAAFGAAHILKFRSLIANTMTNTVPSMAGANRTGASTEWEWEDCELRLLSEPAVYGGMVHSSSFYDVGEWNQQLPLFKLAQDKKVAMLGHGSTSRSSWWLSTVGHAPAFCLVDTNGPADAHSASHANGVRPAFLFI